LKKIQGFTVYLGKSLTLTRGWGENINDLIWGNKHEKGEEENVKEKGEKSKDKGEIEVKRAKE
jgi:hypothetical protein